MKKGLFLFGWVICAMVWPHSVFAAEQAQVVSFALVIGSNRPGGGQEALSFAKRDAQRFGAVLKELAGYKTERITTLFDPNAEKVKGALKQMSDRVKKHVEAGEKTTFVFYYSGHARSTALNLGKEEIPLDGVRSLIDGIPAQFKLIVLDACQTGAYSKVKGVTPAADFSHNSVIGLNKEGTVVIASSAASELAQESDRLKGSFFTHHLVAALRGAADANADGLVTLDEAYRYAYNRTLVDTAKTAVGKQHVTLETELRGKGETILSRPKGAKAWLKIPKAVTGETLIFRASDKQVVAEVHKAGDRDMTLALPPAAYELLVRQKERGYSCKQTLGRGGTAILKLDDCDRVKLEKPGTKGSKYRRNEHLFFEVGFGMMWPKQDAYDTRLEDFYYSQEVSRDFLLHIGAVGYWSVLRYLKIGLQYSLLDESSYDGEDQSFSWRAHRIGVVVRGVLPLANDWLAFYAQASGGLGFAKTTYSDHGTSNLIGTSSPVVENYEEHFVGFYVSGGGGIQLLPWQYAGFFTQAEYTYAPVIKNLLDDTHDSGGLAVTTGVMGGF